MQVAWKNVPLPPILVPEYDVVLPFHSNDDGEFISFNLRGGGRQRRSLNDLHRPNYKLRAFGKDLHLKLVRNDRLMAPGLRLEKVFPDGRTSRSAELQNTFYLGHVASDPNSMVAVSNDEGLVSILQIAVRFTAVCTLTRWQVRKVSSIENLDLLCWPGRVKIVWDTLAECHTLAINRFHMRKKKPLSAKLYLSSCPW